MKLIFISFLSLLLFSCKTENGSPEANLAPGDTLSVTHAKGFSIVAYEGYKLLNVNSPWPGADRSFTYLLEEEGAAVPEEVEYDQRVKIPVRNIIVTSTTHIPSLESLEEENTLIGFPGVNYISSQTTRERIENGKVAEVGKNENLNTEIIISLSPDVVVGFAVNSTNKTLNTIEKGGIPVVFNGDWIEDSPLGKAEWIKFFGALYNKSSLANELFEEVETAYKEAKELAGTATNVPTVLSGSMFRDQWYVPYGNSWSARFIEDANANYIYKNTSGSGSRALAFENVLSDAHDADFWIAPGQFTSYEQLEESSIHYNQFQAVKNRSVYTYSNTKGATGGVIYYELAPNRPDLVLKDLISIFHPHLLREYEPVFFKPLQ